MAIRTTSARMAITIATGQGWQSPDWEEVLRLGCKVDRSGKGTNIPAILHGLDCGRVLSALEQADRPAQDWAVLAYGAPGFPDDDCPHRVHERLIVAYMLCQDRAPKAPGKVRDLGWVAMHDMRLRLVNHISLAPADVAAKVGFDVRHWRRWEPKMREMQTVLDAWDKEALGRVAEVLPYREAV